MSSAMHSLKVKIPSACKVLSRGLSTFVEPPDLHAKLKGVMDYKNAKKFEEIPGPPSLPIIGSLWLYYHPFKKYSFERLHETYGKMYREYGPIVREVQSKKRTLVHIYDYNDIRLLFRSQDMFPRRISHTALAKYRAERPGLYAGPGLLPSNDLEWLRFRSYFDEVLFNVTDSRPALEDVVDEMLKLILHRLDANSEIDVTPLFYRWGLESIGRIMLNKNLGCLSTSENPEAETLIKTAKDTHIATYLSENISFNYNKYYKMLRDAQDTFTGIVGKYLDEALAVIDKEENQKSMLARILKKNPDIDRRNVFTMVVDSFLGGIDNSSFALSMALYNLAQNKYAQDKLRKEMIEVMPTKDVRFTESEHKKLYLELVMKESMRVTPHAVANGRITKYDLVLGGYFVPKDTIVLIQHQVASLLEKHFPNPHSFEPERYLKEILPLAQGYISRPFGHGNRLCIGMNIARQELFIALGKIIRNYEVSYHYDKIGMKTILMNIPDKPVRLRFKKIEY